MKSGPQTLNNSFYSAALILLLFISASCHPNTHNSMTHLPPNVIPRSEWGATEPNITGSVEGAYHKLTNPAGWLEYTAPLSQTLKTIVVHHSALPLTDGPLAIQKKHFEAKGYADIGYHYIIDENGLIYEGRKLNVRGAHTGGFNTGSVGVVLLGNFEHTQPTAPQTDSLISLNRFLKETYKITHIAGHRDFQPEETVCPGEHLEPLLPELAKLLDLEFGTGGYVGPTHN